MAINLGKISKIGAEINVRCTSGTGQLLKISVHEFQEKILGYNFVGSAIKESIHNKLIQYVNKTGNRYEKIKEFNSKKVMFEEPMKEASPVRAPIRTNINDIISQKLVDRRDILREIVQDYPETKKMVEFNGFEPITITS